MPSIDEIPIGYASFSFSFRWLYVLPFRLLLWGFSLLCYLGYLHLYLYCGNKMANNFMKCSLFEFIENTCTGTRIAWESQCSRPSKAASGDSSRIGYRIEFKRNQRHNTWALCCHFPVPRISAAMPHMATNNILNKHTKVLLLKLFDHKMCIGKISQVYPILPHKFVWIDVRSIVQFYMVKMTKGRTQTRVYILILSMTNQSRPTRVDLTWW